MATSTNGLAVAHFILRSIYNRIGEKNPRFVIDSNLYRRWKMSGLKASVLVCSLILASAIHAASITISVDANVNRKPINPNVYGVANATAAQLSDLNSSMERSGGNGMTRYNWQQNCWNHANDWFYETIAESSSTAGAMVDSMITDTHTAGAQPLVTIPMIGYIGNLAANRGKTWSFSVAKYGAQTSTDGDAGNGISTASGNPFITGNNPLDANVANSTSIQLAWMQHLKSTWGAASAGGVKYYIMDNEHSLWHSTHRDVHPVGATMNEIYNDFTAYSGQVKSNDSGALVLGPEEWGWSGYFYSGYDLQYGAAHGWSNLPDRTAHGNMDYMPWLLQNLKSYDTTNGTKSIDIFSLHWYPQSGEFSNDDSATAQANRNKSTRSLWDPNYTDISWIGSVVQLIPRMKGWVSTYYPGLQTALTEYNWGDEANMNGATAQADLFGIFGREGLDMACRWGVPASTTPTYLAMKMYRNYDGTKTPFGDVSISCTVPNADQQSAFAAQRVSDSAVTIMVINKITSSQAVTINIANFTPTGTAHRYQLSANVLSQLSDIAVTSNSISDTAPAQSVTLYVVPFSSGGSAPPAPTNLAAAAGNTQVALTWNASTGATGYNVYRGTTSGGENTTPIATGIATTSYTDTGLANGTTYYYEVKAVNSFGISGYSNEASATPFASGTIAIQDAVSATVKGTGTVTLPYTVTSGAKVLVVGVTLKSSGASPGVTSITYNGTTMTQAVLTQSVQTAYRSTAIYYLYNPAAGSSLNIVGTFTNTSDSFINAFTLNGTDTTAAPITGGADSQAGTATSVSLTGLTAGSYAVGVQALNLTAATTYTFSSSPAGSAATLWNNFDSAAATVSASGRESGLSAGNCTLTGTVGANSGTKNVLSVAVFKPGAAPAIAVQDAPSATVKGTTTVTLPYTVTSGAKVLVVGITLKSNGGNPGVTSVTYNGTALTQGILFQSVQGTYRSSAIYYLFNPAPGTSLNIVGTFTNVSDSFTTAFTLKNAGTTSAPITGGADSQTGAATSVSVTGVPAGGFAVGVQSLNLTATTTDTFSSSPVALPATLWSNFDSAAATYSAGGSVAGLSAGNNTITGTVGANSGMKNVLVVAVFKP